MQGQEQQPPPPVPTSLPTWKFLVGSLARELERERERCSAAPSIDNQSSSTQTSKAPIHRLDGRSAAAAYCSSHRLRCAAYSPRDPLSPSTDPPPASHPGWPEPSLARSRDGPVTDAPGSARRSNGRPGQRDKGRASLPPAIVVIPGGRSPLLPPSRSPRGTLKLPRTPPAPTAEVVSGSDACNGHPCEITGGLPGRHALPGRPMRPRPDPHSLARLDKGLQD